MNDKEILNELKRVDKVSKKVKKAKVSYIKSLSKCIELGLLTLTEIDLGNENHISKLKIIVKELDDTIIQANELIKDYRNSI
jgi:hypothetical protein